jgi:hypothetical protein
MFQINVAERNETQVLYVTSYATFVYNRHLG